MELVHGILQARILEWVAVPFSRGSSQLRDQTRVSRIIGRRFYPLSHQGSRHDGEGNGNPLQSSCLQNPRNRRAWWAAIYGVSQSRTGLSDLAAAAAAGLHEGQHFLPVQVWQL